MATPVQNWVGGPQHDTMPILLELGVPSQSASLAHLTQPMPQGLEHSLTQPTLNQPLVQAMTMPQPMTQPTSQVMTMPQPMTQPTSQVISHQMTHQIMPHQAFTQSMMSQPITQAMTQVLTEAVTQANIGRCEMETQTIPEWDHLMKISIQTYLEHKLIPLLETRLRGSKCIHLKGLNFEDLLAMVVERHNTLCVHPSVLEEKKLNAKVQPVDRFSEADAAAKVMVDLLNAQHQDILQANKDLHAAIEGVMEDGFHSESQDGEPKKKVPRKRGDVSTKEELLKKGVKLIRCEPPDHVVDRARQMWGKKLDRARHIPAKKWYQCADCGLKLEDIHKLGRHITKHSTTRAFQCPQCKRMYKTQDAVRKHVKENHTPGFKFKVFCQYCSKGFKSRKHRDDHLTVHTGESAFKCTECGKAFKSKRSVIGHMRTRHKIGKLHYCSLCECHFPFMNLLHSHLQCVHKAQVPQAMQQIFINKCLICEEKFQDEQSLMQHMPTHGKQECIGCARRETRRNNVLQEATKRGLNPEQAASLDFKNLEDWVRDEKAKEMADKKAKRETAIRDKAIALGMDPDLAIDIKQVRVYLNQQKKGPKRQKNENEKEAGERQPTASASTVVTVHDLSIEELQHRQVESLRRERKIKNDMEQMEKSVNQRAIDIALEIIESVEADQILDQPKTDQTSAVTQTEMKIIKNKKRRKKLLTAQLGKVVEKLKEKSLGKLEGEERVELGDEREESVKERSANQSQDQVLTLDAHYSQDEPVEQSRDLLKDYENQNSISLPPTEETVTKQHVRSTNENSDSSNASCSSDVEDSHKVKCTVYSQDPKLTLSLVKSGRAKFVIDKSDSQDVKGIHLVSVKQGHTNPKIVLSTNTPDKIKDKVTKGKLTIHVLPLSGVKLVGQSDKAILNEAGSSKEHIYGKADKTSQQSISANEKKNPQSTTNLNQKTKVKLRSAGPQRGPKIDSIEDLKSRGVKIIPCDPPDHVLTNAINSKSSYYRARKQWYQCEHCGKKVEDISKLKTHIERTKKCTALSKPTAHPQVDNKFPDLEPGEIRVGGPIKSISISKSKIKIAKGKAKMRLEQGEIRLEQENINDISNKLQTSGMIRLQDLESGDTRQFSRDSSNSELMVSSTEPSCSDNTAFGTPLATSFKGKESLHVDEEVVEAAEDVQQHPGTDHKMETTGVADTPEEQNCSKSVPLSMECVTVSNQVQGEVLTVSPDWTLDDVESSKVIATVNTDIRSDDAELDEDESTVVMEIVDSESDASTLMEKIQKGLT